MSARERRAAERDDPDQDFGSVPDDDGGVPSSSISRERDDGLDDSGGSSRADDAGRNDSRSSQRVGGTGSSTGSSRDRDDDDDRVSGGTAGGGRGPRFDDDPSPEPEPEPTPEFVTERFTADAQASRRVGGSGDPFDEPEAATVDVGGAADSGQGPRVGISDQSPFVDVAAAAELDAQTQTDVGVGDIEIDGNTARLTRGAAVNEALSRQRDSRQGDASTDERFGDLDFSFGRGDPDVDEVEQFVDSLPERADETFRGPSEAVFLPDSPGQRAGRTGSARALDALGFERSADRAEEGVREFGSELLPQTASGVASAPGLALEGIEFAATRQNADELPDAAVAAGQQQVEAAQTSPARFGAGVVGGAAVGAGLSRGLRRSRGSGRSTGSTARRSLDERLSDIRARTPEIEITRDPFTGPLDINPDVADALRDRLPDTPSRPSGPSNAPAGDSLSDILGTAGQPRVGRPVRSVDVDTDVNTRLPGNAPAGETLSDIFGTAGQPRVGRTVSTPRFEFDTDALPSNAPAGDSLSDIFGTAGRPGVAAQARTGSLLDVDLGSRLPSNAPAGDSLSDIFGTAGRPGSTASRSRSLPDFPSINPPAGDTPRDIFGAAGRGPGPDGTSITGLLGDLERGRLTDRLPSNAPAGESLSDIFGTAGQAGSAPDIGRLTPTLRIGGGRRRGRRGRGDSDADADVDTPDDTPDAVDVDLGDAPGGAGGTGQLTSLRLRRDRGGDADTDFARRRRARERSRARDALDASITSIGIAAANDVTGIGTGTGTGIGELDATGPTVGLDEGVGTDIGPTVDEGTGLTQPTTGVTETTGATTGSGTDTVTTPTTRTPLTPTTTTTTPPATTTPPNRPPRTPAPRLPEFDAADDELDQLRVGVDSADFEFSAIGLDAVDEDLSSEVFDAP